MSNFNLALQQTDKPSPFTGYKTPFLIITPTFIIRPLVNEDKNAVIQALRESLKMLHMWLPWTEERPSANDFMSVGNKFFEESASGYTINYVVYQNDKLMGMCILGNYDKRAKAACLGYWCRSSFEEKNNFSDAVNAIIDYSFQSAKLKEIYIPCVVGNFLNESVAKELNFKLKSIELTEDRQIKLFKIDQSISLPKLEIHYIMEDRNTLKQS